MLQDDVQDATAALAAALRTGNAAAAAARYAADAALLTPRCELIRGRPDIEAYWRAGVEVGLCDAALEPAGLQAARGVIVEVGRYRLSFGAQEGAAVVDEGTYLAVHRRRAGGGWHRSLEAYQPDAPDAARRAAADTDPPEPPGRVSTPCEGGTG